MQINKVLEIPINSEYYEPFIKRCKGWICRFENNKCFFEKTQILEFQIKKVVDCIIINDVAYIADEYGCIYEADLKMNKVTKTSLRLSADITLYEFKNNVLICAEKNEFYKTAYIYSNGILEEISNNPPQCLDIFVFENDIFYLCSDVFSSKDNIKLYKSDGNISIECFYSTNSKITPLNIGIDFKNSLIAYWNGKKLTVVDFLWNSLWQLKFNETIHNVGFVSNGKYMLILTSKRIEIRNTNNFCLEGTICFNCSFPTIKYRYENSYINLITDSKSVLYDII